MSKEKRQKRSQFDDKPFIPLDLNKAHLPVELAHKKFKIEQRKTLEFNPEKIKPGEGVIVKIPKWGGLSKVAYAVLNVNGKYFEIRPLK